MAQSPPRDLARPEARRSARPLLKIPIQVEGQDAEGKPFSEITYTLTINRYGARIALKITLRPDAEIKITNLKTQQTCLFRVVARLDVPLGRGVEWGVECLAPRSDFWEVYFPDRKGRIPLEQTIDVLLECSVCHSREMAQLAVEKYRQVINESPEIRSCARCGGETPWGLGLVEITRQEMASPQINPLASELSAPGGAERRRENRYVVLLPVSIRDQTGKEEATKTENLSKTGVCFAADLEMEEGSTVLLTVGPAGGEQTQLPGRIVWRRPVAMGRSLYGVRLEEEE